MIQSYGYGGSAATTSPATYQAAFDFTSGGSGVALEILGSGTKTVKILEIYIHKPSVAVDLTFTKRSTACTGGTAASATLVPFSSASSAATAVVKSYTAVPTAGTSVGDVKLALDVTAGDILAFAFGDNGDQPVTLRSAAETLTIQTTVAVNLTGYVRFTEES